MYNEDSKKALELLINFSSIQTHTEDLSTVTTPIRILPVNRTYIVMKQQGPETYILFGYLAFHEETVREMDSIGRLMMLESECKSLKEEEFIALGFALEQFIQNS